MLYVVAHYIGNNKSITDFNKLVVLHRAVKKFDYMDFAMTLHLYHSAKHVVEGCLSGNFALMLTKSFDFNAAKQVHKFWNLCSPLSFCDPLGCLNFYFQCWSLHSLHLFLLGYHFYPTSAVWSLIERTSLDFAVWTNF